MATKIYPFTTPANYTFDSDKIEVSGGLAKIKEDLTNIYARYHLNSIDTGDSVEDNSGNGRDGIAINNPSVIVGKLNNGFSFNGINQYINCGNIGNFERTDIFSIEFWIKSSSNGNIIGKYESIPPFTWRGWRIGINSSGKAYFQLQHDYEPNNAITVVADNKVVDDNIWHHIIVTYDGSNQANGAHIYVNNNDETLTVVSDNLTGIILNNANCEINGYNNGSGAFITCLMDEAIIYNKELNSTEVSYRYNSGNGRENVQYYLDKPTIEPTDLFNPTTISSWDSFLETLGGGNEGSIGYNLYKVDKANKYYWNGSVWIIGGDSDHYNSQAVVNTNISAFDATPDKIGFIAYLISDGEQKIELDENQITYLANISPLVNAGSSKICKDNQSIAPFSDCTASDPDGTIDYVYYRVDGEVDTWSQIPQGGYGTLLEAVQAWTYQFANIGTKIVRLQVEDNEGAKSEDSLEVIVSKYTVTFNVKDATGTHVSDFYFLDGISPTPQLKSSPITYDYDYKATPYNTVFYKDDYITSTAEVESTDHTENIILAKTAYKETSRIYHPIRIDAKNKKSIIKTLIKGDTILFEVKVEADLTDWKIRAELWDDETIDIKKATTNAGGSDAEIEVTDAIGGVFIVKIVKGETINIKNQANLEIEVESNEGNIWTIFQSILNFVTNKIT